MKNKTSADYSPVANIVILHRNTTIAPILIEIKNSFLLSNDGKKQIKQEYCNWKTIRTKKCYMFICEEKPTVKSQKVARVC